MGRFKLHIPLLLYWRVGVAERKTQMVLPEHSYGKCPETATCYLSANASPYLHFPQVFFSYTVSLGCYNQIKDFPEVFLNVLPSKLSLFQQNKTQFSVYYTELFFQGSFLTSSPLQHLLYFCTEWVHRRKGGICHSLPGCH